MWCYLPFPGFAVSFSLIIHIFHGWMQLIHMIAHSSEFENIMVREEEQQELSQLVRRYCPFEVRGGPEDKYGKINILIQVFPLFWSLKPCPFRVLSLLGFCTHGFFFHKFLMLNFYQVYLSRGFLDGFSLVADSSYINASLGRIMRALFEICLRRSWVTMAALLLEYCKAVDRRVWPHQHPLRQFDAILSQDVRSLWFWSS